MAPSSKRRSPTAPRDRTKRRYCSICRDKVEHVDYKDFNQLRRFLTDSGKIRPRHVTGACRRHQSQLAVAIKRAREIALLPYAGGARELSSEDRRRSSRSKRG